MQALGKRSRVTAPESPRPKPPLVPTLDFASAVLLNGGLEWEQAWKCRSVCRVFRAAVHSDGLWQGYYKAAAAGKAHEPPHITALLKPKRAAERGVAAAGGGAAEPGGAAEVAAPERLRIGPFFEAFLLARKEAERTAIAADELAGLTFFTRRRLHSGNTEAALAKLCKWWSGSDAVNMNHFGSDGKCRMHEPAALENADGSAQGARPVPPTAEWSVIGSWSFIPAPAGMPDSATYIRTIHEQSRWNVVYQVRRQPDWVWQLVSANVVKASSRFPQQRSGQHGAIDEDPELFTLDEHCLMLDAEGNGV